MKAVTGNRLRDGAVIYRRTDGGWTTDIAEAAAYGEDADLALKAAEADVGAAIVVGIELIDVVKGASGVEPVSLRERIRAYGPTILSSTNA
jgi:sulfite reductase (NADPH) hemoprotein beta-component